MKYKKIHYKSDFDFILRLRALGTNGEWENVGFPDYSFTISLFTSQYRKYLASYNKETNECINCRNNNGEIQVIVNDHRLPIGKLQIEFYADIPDNNYPNNSKLIVCDSDTGIELVTGSTDLNTEDIITIEPYIKFTYSDMSEEDKNSLAIDISNKIDNPFSTGNQSNSAVLKDSKNKAVAPYSIAVGYNTEAQEVGAFSSGVGSKAIGSASLSTGYYTITSNKGEHAEGVYNMSIKGITLHSVGIGTSDTDRKNAHEIDVEGKHYILGLGDYNGTNAAEAKDLKSVIDSQNLQWIDVQ